MSSYYVSRDTDSQTNRHLSFSMQKTIHDKNKSSVDNPTNIQIIVVLKYKQWIQIKPNCYWPTDLTAYK